MNLCTKSSYEGIHLLVCPDCIDEEAINYNSIASEADVTCVYK